MPYINCLGGGAWSDPDPGVITPSTLGTVQGSKDLTVCCGSYFNYQFLYNKTCTISLRYSNLDNFFVSTTFCHSEEGINRNVK